MMEPEHPTTTQTTAWPAPASAVSGETEITRHRLVLPLVAPPDEATVVAPALPAPDEFLAPGVALADQPTVVAPCRPAWGGPAETLPGPPGAVPCAIPAVVGPALEDSNRVEPRLRELFAEPPVLRAEEEVSESPETRRRRRRKRMLLAFVAVAGTWLLLEPGEPSAAPTGSRVLVVEPAAARVPDRPVLHLEPASSPVDPTAAATHLAAGRYEAALPMYETLAHGHPDDAVYAVIVNVLTREVIDRCRTRASNACR
jgi:hypothetical protein